MQRPITDRIVSLLPDIAEGKIDAPTPQPHKCNVTCPSAHHSAWLLFAPSYGESPEQTHGAGIWGLALYSLLGIE
jgi:hypothetical protein